MDKQAIGKLSQNDRNSVLYSGMTDEESIHVIDELCYKLIK